MHYIHYILTLHALHTYIHTLHYTTLHITLHYNTLQYITIHYITLHTYILQYITIHYLTLHYIRLHSIHTYTYLYIYIDIYILFIFIFIPKLGLITGLSITSCLLLLGSWLSNIISCYILAATILAFEHYFSWLSNIAPYTVFVAAPLLTFKYAFLLQFCCYTLGFPTQLPVFCCYALDFQTLLPTTFLLLRSGVSNITYDCVSAARLLSFHHKLVLFMLVAAMLLTFSHCFHYFLLVVATLLTFNHYFLLRSCCYALGFPT